MHVAQVVWDVAVIEGKKLHNIDANTQWEWVAFVHFEVLNRLCSCVSTQLLEESSRQFLVTELGKVIDQYSWFFNCIFC